MEILNNYFQRYSSKENVVTDNTMRLLNLLREHNIKFFNLFLEKIKIVEENQSLNMKIVVQEKENKSGSVPDAILTQIGYKIVVEVKLSNNFTLEQLENHLKKLDGNTDNKILLTIGNERMQKKLKEEIDAKCMIDSIKHINLTYNDIIQTIFDIIPNDDSFYKIIQDYKEFCSNNGLLENSHNKMYAFTTKDSKEINLKYNLYYRPIQNYESFDYIGLYYDKKVEYIGEVEKVVVVDIKEEKPVIKDSDLSEAEINRILNAIAEQDNFDNNQSYYFYLIKKYVPTNFVKVTPYPIWSRKLFNLKEVLGTQKDICDLSIEEIAEALKSKTWE